MSNSPTEQQHEEEKEEKEEQDATSTTEEEQASSIMSSTRSGGSALTEEEEDSSTYFDDVQFMFQSNQPTVRETFRWMTDSGQQVTVSLHVVDDAPGSLQSGHYLWPGATLLTEHLVHNYSSSHHHEEATKTTTKVVRSCVELGAGSALCSLAACQIFRDTLQCCVVTDHDPGCLVRARDNHETTLQTVLDAISEEEDLNQAINDLASIPILFESLEWGDLESAQRIVDVCLEEHCTAEPNPPTHFDLILGSDLIYSCDVVEPLFQTAALFMTRNRKNNDRDSLTSGRFILSQSFAYDTEIEEEIDRVCEELGLGRKIIRDNIDVIKDDGGKQEGEDTDEETTQEKKRVGRIQEFTFAEGEETHVPDKDSS
jgi:predicted nicotinamide N-methyase